MRNPGHSGILEVIMSWPEGKNFGMSPEEDVAHADNAPLYNKSAECEKRYALFTAGSCHHVGRHQIWKASVWSPLLQATETTKGEGELSQFAEVKAIKLALDAVE